MKELKPFCLRIISDLFISCRQEIFKYFDDIMKMIGGAIQACQMNYGTEMDSVDFINYLIKLKEGLLETLSCIFAAVEEKQKTTEFVPYAKEIVNFINIILREDGQLNMEIIKSCIGIIADFCVVYGSNIKPILNGKLLRDSIEKFKKSEENMGNEQMRQYISWAQKCITDVLISN